MCSPYNNYLCREVGGNRQEKNDLVTILLNVALMKLYSVSLTVTFVSRICQTVSVMCVYIYISLFHHKSPRGTIALIYLSHILCPSEVRSFKC